MLQKVVTVNMKKLCEERLATEGRDLSAIGNEEGRALFTRVLNDFLEQ